MSDFTQKTLIDAFMQNREIEFSLNGHPYFAEPRSNPPLPICYEIWDVETHQCIFRGGLNEMLSFSFPGGYSLEANFDEFDILYIL